MMQYHRCFTSLPNKILETSRSKFAAENSVPKIKNIAYERLENIVKKEENSGNQHFLLFS